MSTLRTPAFLLAVALLFTQALAVAHAFDHPAAQQADHCLYCAHGHGLDHVPADTTPVVVTRTAAEPPAATLTEPTPTHRHPGFQSRAPPPLI